MSVFKIDYKFNLNPNSLNRRAGRERIYFHTSRARDEERPRALLNMGG